MFPKLNIYERIILGMYVYYHMYSLSTIFDQKSYGTILEISRLIIAIPLLYRLNLTKFLTLNIIINTISIIWILIFNKKTEEKKIQ